MAGEKKAAIVACVMGLAIAAPPASWAGDGIEIPLESCTQAETDAHGEGEYRDEGDRERLRFDIHDTTPGLIGETLDVVVDGEDVGSMEVVESDDPDEPGRGEGTLEFDTDDGDELPTTLEGGETVEIEHDGEPVVSSECEGFDDSPSGGGSDGGGSDGGGQPGGGGAPPSGGVDGLLQTLLGLLGLGR